VVPRTTTIELGLVIPLQGPAGIFGPSCEACAQLAADELNLGPGVLAQELNLVVIDGGQAPQQVAAAVSSLVSARAVDAITGWHTSAVRQAVVPRIAGRVPYVYGRPCMRAANVPVACSSLARRRPDRCFPVCGGWPGTGAYGGGA
jgi:urea transport system substrate-binding protein